MIDEIYISQLPKKVKVLLGIFLLVLSVGYFSGLLFVDETTGNSPVGIEENYIGNEDSEGASEMKLRKSQHEMLNNVHTHILSMSLIFLILSCLVYGFKLSTRIKSFLMFEPLMSVLVTFGGIYL